MAARLQVVIGGSRRQLNRHLFALEGIEHTKPIRCGVKRATVIVADTPELRELISRTPGMNVAKEQPEWLRREG